MGRDGLSHSERHHLGNLRKMSMKALVLKEYNNLIFEDLPEPKAGPYDVIIKVKACGICGSDVHGVDGSTGRRKPPIIMGHEAAGVIVEAGSNVQGWSNGDRVTFDSTIYCGVCDFCCRGDINLCNNRRVLGVSCNDYRQNGAFAEFVVVPHHILYRLPDTVSFEQGAMVEALSIALHAVSLPSISLNDTALVVGTGMIGLLIVQALRASGCGSIIAVDMAQDRLELARSLGADVCLKADTRNVPEEVKKLTSGRGADIAFEAVGVQPSVESAVESLTKGGSLVLVGNLSPRVELPLVTIVTRQLILYGSCASCGEYPACLDMIARGAIDVDALISATARLSEGASWFDRLYRKEAGLMKVILQP